VCGATVQLPQEKTKPATQGKQKKRNTSKYPLQAPKREREIK